MVLHWLMLQEAREEFAAQKDRCLALIDQAEQLTRDPDVLRRLLEVREIWSRISGT